jgi:hypothetical protein
MDKAAFRKWVSESGIPKGEWIAPTKVGSITLNNGFVVSANLDTMRFRIGDGSIDVLYGSPSSIGTMLIDPEISYDMRVITVERIAKNRHGLRTELPKAGDLMVSMDPGGKTLAMAGISATYMSGGKVMIELSSAIGMDPHVFEHSCVCYYDPAKIGGYPTLGKDEVGVFMSFAPNPTKWRKDYHMRIPRGKIAAIQGR